MTVVLWPLLAAFAASWTPPQARGPWARGLRDSAAAFYGRLQDGSMRLRPDLARATDSLRGPAGAASWRLSREGGPRPGGAEVLRLEWTDSVGTLLRADRFPVRVAREELVPVARRRLYAGADLDTADLQWEWRRTDGAVQPPAPSADLAGRRLARGVGPGQALLAGALEPPTLFRRQDRVRVVLDRQGTRIVSEGMALEDGRVGRRVLVRGPFGADVRGRVAADSSVVVE